MIGDSTPTKAVDSTPTTPLLGEFGKQNTTLGQGTPTMPLFGDFGKQNSTSSQTQLLGDFGKQSSISSQDSQHYVLVSTGPSAQIRMGSSPLMSPVAKSFQNLYPAGVLATPLIPESSEAVTPVQDPSPPLSKVDEDKSPEAEGEACSTQKTRSACSAQSMRFVNFARLIWKALTPGNEPWARLASGHSMRTVKQVDELSRHPTDEEGHDVEDLRAPDTEVQGPQKDSEAQSPQKVQAPRTRTTLPFTSIEVPLQVLPAVLLISTIASAVCMILVQCQILHDILQSNLITFIFSFLYILTLGCMVYCILGSPGLMKEDESPWPERTRKTWLYERPVYRYDHYCRWLVNCIGLLNHREFMLMLIGLELIAIAGFCVDVIVLFVVAHIGAWAAGVAIVLHLVESLLKARFVGSILRMHIGFVSRNELCAEWKQDIFWRVQPTTLFILDQEEDKGVRAKKMLKDMTPEELSQFEEGDKLDGFVVHDLSAATYNAMLPETNCYDASLNVHDLGWARNCLAFWTTPRWIGPRWTEDRLDGI